MSDIKKLICTKHGGNPIGVSNFYIAGESSIFGGLGRIPICKKCLYLEVEKYYNKSKDLRLSMYFMCRKIDVAFDTNTFEGSTKSEDITIVKIFQNYMRQINSIGGINGSMSCFDEGEHIDEREDKKDDVIEDNDDSEKDFNSDFAITEDIINFWGRGLDDDEYLFLINELHEYTSSYECDSPAMERLLQQAAYESLEIRRKRESRESADKNLKNLQDLLGAANIKPVQETGADANDQVTFGTLIKKWENEEPIPEPLPEWNDKDVFKYMRTWFLGHLSKMVGLNNPFEKEYEEEIAKNTVATPFEDGDV